MDNIENTFVKNDNVQLEAEYFSSNSDNNTAVLLIHPHPQFPRA